jgi:flagellar export protein FliJ
MPQAFAFRFETLLRLRRQREEEQRRVVAARLRLIAAVQRRQDLLRRRIDQESEAIRASLRGPAADIEQLRWGRHWLSRLRRGALEAEAELAAHRAMLAQERAALLEARTRHEVLHRLKEMQVDQHRAALARREQAEADEMSVLRFSHNRRMHDEG